TRLLLAGHFQRGRELYVNNTVLSTVSCCTLLCMVLHSRAIQSSVPTVESTHTAYSKTAHSYPFDRPRCYPFMPSAISTVSMFFVSTDHCIGVTGDVSETKSVPLQCQNACRSPAISH
ncbi:unnamed protein product, partial [Staurois parvus]